MAVGAGVLVRRSIRRGAPLAAALLAVAIVAATLLAAVLLLAVACQPTPPPPSKSDLVGAWCGPNGEILTLGSDNSFTIERVSERYVNDVLHQDGYVEGYRLRTEFAGVVPTSAAGSWTLQLRGNDWLDSYDNYIYLTFSALGDRATDEDHRLFLEHENRQTYLLVDRKDGYHRMFERCPSPAPSR